jgi:hypothetical protein
MSHAGGGCFPSALAYVASFGTNEIFSPVLSILVPDLTVGDAALMDGDFERRRLFGMGGSAAALRKSRFACYELTRISNAVVFFF